MLVTSLAFRFLVESELYIAYLSGLEQDLLSGTIIN